MTAQTPSYNRHRYLFDTYGRRCIDDVPLALRRCIALVILMWGYSSAVRGESYNDFEDLLDCDRTGEIFTEVRKADSVNDAVTISVWTRKTAEELIDRAERNLPSPPQASLTPGTIRTLLSTSSPGHPSLVRTSSSAVALLGYHGLDALRLRHAPAVRLFNFDGDSCIEYKLDELFANGFQRFHRKNVGNGGTVGWLRDAWFDQSGRRLFIVAGRDRTRRCPREAITIDLDSRKIETVDDAAIKRQLEIVDKRFLHVAFELAANRAVDGVSDVAEKLFRDESTPPPARLRAACYLEKRGNPAAEALLTELASFQRVPPKDIQHAMIPAGAAYDMDFWLETIGFAAWRGGEWDFESHSPPTSRME